MTSRGCALAVAVLGAVLTGHAATPAATAPADGVLAQYRQRHELLRRQIPAITASAEAVARRWTNHPAMLLHFPFGGDTSNFSMELISRAGGLDNAQPDTVRVPLRSGVDVFVGSARSWETGAAYLVKKLPLNREAGWLNVLFASRAGMPTNLPADWVIDNGAATGSASEAALNSIANVELGWMWCCELTSALTRLGQRPAVLKGMLLPGATAHNKEYQRAGQAPLLYPCDTAIPAGALAEAYRRGVTAALDELESAARQAQIARAADFAAARLRAGKAVWASSYTHVLDGEVLVDARSPIRAFRGISCGANGETFTTNMKEGDLLLWFGEWTVNLPWRDYAAIIRSTRAAYIPSWRRGPEPLEAYDRADDVSDALMTVDQGWPIENAVVPIPFPPGKMAPVSGVYVCLLWRSLDEAVAARCAAAPAAGTP